MEPIRVFISHSNRDRKIASTLAEALRVLRMEPFLAHDDIEGGEEWRGAIRREIKGCDVLVALVTKDFRISEYAGQEVGAAWVLRKPMLPVCVDDLTPPGFMADNQRVRYDGNNPISTAKNALKITLASIHGEDNVMEKLAEVLATVLVKLESTDDIEFLIDSMKNERFTAEQRTTLSSAFESNPRLRRYRSNQKIMRVMSRFVTVMDGRG